MHLAVAEYEPKRRLVMRTPKLQRNAGIAFLILSAGMVLWVPFAYGVTWVLARYTDVIDVKQERIIYLAGFVATVPFVALTALVVLFGLWLFRRRCVVEIDAILGTVIHREHFLRGEREERFAMTELQKSTCNARLKSAREGRRGGGSLTSYAVNLIFRDGSVVNFESLDSRIPAIIEQVVPNVQTS